MHLLHSSALVEQWVIIACFQRWRLLEENLLPTMKILKTGDNMVNIIAGWLVCYLYTLHCSKLRSVMTTMENKSTRVLNILKVNLEMLKKSIFSLYKTSFIMNVFEPDDIEFVDSKLFQYFLFIFWLVYFYIIIVYHLPFLYWTPDCY